MENIKTKTKTGWKKIITDIYYNTLQFIFNKKEDSGLILHAKKELVLAGYDLNDKEEGPNKWIVENILELLRVFSKQGHSGSSASYCISVFKTLASYELLTPLTENDEWMCVSDYFNGKEVYQNIRCGSVFKEGINGKPYYLDAIVWRNQDNCTFTGAVKNSKGERITSHQHIKIPFTPKTFYIDVFDYETEDDTVHFIKDESQLKEVWKYYEHQETPSWIRLQKLKRINL